ncbi:OLC1v1025302C1 [Oldenlandia corymbosa var. corymbosa]|uniref:OLC1v1025302C1 n=1 Tax=Oldenlandia corymbosa var. corymbosa TaxID=529605 RepID=A0AAV1C4K2_OLDCO|nr:OLC1v1025302C1 [Oldenlandia corymbosa var. corymbosa]
MPQYCVDCKKIGHDHHSCRHNKAASSLQTIDSHQSKQLSKRSAQKKQANTTGLEKLGEKLSTVPLSNAGQQHFQFTPGLINDVQPPLNVFEVEVESQSKDSDPPLQVNTAAADGRTDVAVQALPLVEARRASYDAFAVEEQSIFPSSSHPIAAQDRSIALPLPDSNQRTTIEQGASVDVAIATGNRQSTSVPLPIVERAVSIHGETTASPEP